jgi:hypothetical protein
MNLPKNDTGARVGIFGALTLPIITDAPVYEYSICVVNVPQEHRLGQPFAGTLNDLDSLLCVNFAVPKF